MQPNNKLLDRDRQSDPHRPIHPAHSGQTPHYVHTTYYVHTLRTRIQQVHTTCAQYAGEMYDDCNSASLYLPELELVSMELVPELELVSMVDAA